MIKDDDRFILTTKQAAQFIGVSYRTMYQSRCRKRLDRREPPKHVLIDGRIRYLKEDLVQWMEFGATLFNREVYALEEAEFLARTEGGTWYIVRVGAGRYTALQDPKDMEICGSVCFDKGE